MDLLSGRSSNTEGPTELICSARGCRAQATRALRWNNPALHPPERRKTWLVCEDHLESLTQFLSVRSFLRETIGLAHLPLVENGPLS